MNFVCDYSRSPEEILKDISKQHSCAFMDKQFCFLLDENDKLAHFRNQFNIPNIDSPIETQKESKYRTHRL